MYTALIRPVETKSIAIEEAAGLEEVAARIAAEVPEGWAVISSHVKKAGSLLECSALIARRDGIEELEGVDLSDLRGRVPEGYHLLSVRSV